MPSEQTFYAGSNLLEPLSDVVGVGVDKINFVVCMFLSIPIGYLYRKFLPAKQYSKQTRAAVSTVIGFIFCYFCFGNAVKHLAANALISYAFMRFAPGKQVHLFVFFFSMGYLLWVHFYRWLILTSYYLDVTGPIMVAVQKITTLGFSVHDGRGRKRESLSESQKREAVEEPPNLLEYLSFIFNFQTVLTGPMTVYVDWISYLEGTHVPADKEGEATTIGLKKLLQSMGWLILVINFSNVYTPERLADKDFTSLPFWQWCIWWYLVVLFIRVNYYYAWTFADAACNMSGYGYSGEKDDEWSLCTNVKAIKFELAQSFKESLDGWNISSGQWLRRSAYERTPKSIRTWATYLLSSVWHGVSIGYYSTFMTCALFTLAGATFRRCMRWRFLDNPTQKFFYDIMSFFATKVSMAYATYHFVTMNLYPGLYVYQRVYFSIHIIGIMVLVLTPKFFRPQKKDSKEANNNLETKKQS